MATSKKRTIGRILALGMTVSITMTTAWSSAFSAAPEDMESKAESTEQMLPPFADMAGSYASEAVERLASFQLINGVEGDRFLPQKAISRQDFAVLLSKVTGVLPREQVKTRFSDVPEDSPYASYLDPLAEAGILRGRADGSLGAAEELTRQDLAVLLQRVIAASGGLSAQQQDQPVIFQDQAQIAGYAVEAVSDVTAQRWMIGSNGKFLPLAKVSRADAAVIADRILSARSEQAQKVNFSVNVKKLSLLAATSEKIELKAAGGGALPFTPVFSFDHPEIGQVLSDGTFIAGPVKGTGMITVTVGYKTLQIPVEITAIGQAGANSSRENDAAAPAVQSSTKKKPESVEQKQEPASNEHTSQSEESGNAPKQQKDELVN
ncbi:S-layer homology domain-containing protein, partial [Microbacteriaceae bacterium K1510]|nr:S-layer homology domain-containing protein [Microbacteriaceae bacterium K1510]